MIPTSSNDAFRLAGAVTFFPVAAALFVVLPFSFAAFYALLAVMGQKRMESWSPIP